MFGRNKRKWSHEADVVVVGSGAAGLTAALAAHVERASVLILERTSRIGGTTAVSGGGIWIPNNDHMKQGGAADSRDEALRYCKALTVRRASDELVEAFVDSAPEAIRSASS